MKERSYEGYGSYDYLERGEDYRGFELPAEAGPVAVDVSCTLRGDTGSELRDQSIVRLLHDHPDVLPLNTDEIVAYNRHGQEVTCCEGLSASGLDGVVDRSISGLPGAGGCCCPTRVLPGCPPGKRGPGVLCRRDQ